jgi:hypothetical protein
VAHDPYHVRCGVPSGDGDESWPPDPWLVARPDRGAGPVWVAEPEHQDYLEKFPEGLQVLQSAAEMEATQGSKSGR